MSRLLRLAIVLALLAVGCRAEVNMVLDVQEDGSGSFAAEFGFDEEMQQLLELGADGANIEDELFSDFPFGDVGGDGEVEQYIEGDMTFYAATMPFSDVTDIEAEFADDPENPFESFAFEFTDDRVTVDAVVVIPDLTEDADGALPLDPDSISQLTEDVFGFNVKVSLPGEVVQHNADEVMEDGTLRWSIPLTGGRVEIAAESSLGGGGLPLWAIILLIIGGIGLIGVIVALVAGRGRSETDALAGVGAPAPPSPWGEGAGASTVPGAPVPADEAPGGERSGSPPADPVGGDERTMPIGGDEATSTDHDRSDPPTQPLA